MISPLAPTRAAHLLRVATVVALVLAVLVVRLLTTARGELAQGDAARARGDLEAAVVHYGRAARSYVPGSPYHVRALAALAQIGRQAEERGDIDRALSGYKAVRTGILSTRSFVTPEQARLQAANERIAALMAKQARPPMDVGKSEAQLKAEHLALLQADPTPNLGWTIVLLLGFALWVGAAFAFSYRAVDAQDHWVAPEARRWGALIVIGFGMFVLGMLLA